jgi:hypothetical protein
MRRCGCRCIDRALDVQEALKFLDPSKPTGN